MLQKNTDKNGFTIIYVDSNGRISDRNDHTAGRDYNCKITDYKSNTTGYYVDGSTNDRSGYTIGC